MVEQASSLLQICTGKNACATGKQRALQAEPNRMIKQLQRRQQNGITLIELIVAIAAGVMIFSVILAILIRTSAATDASILKATMRQEGRLITDTIVKSLKHCLPATELAPESGGATHFAENQMQFLSLHMAKESQPVQCLIINGQDAKTQLNRVMMKTTPLAGHSASPPPETETREQALGVGGVNIESQVHFRYASSFKTLSPQWVAALKPGRTPRVVEITVIIRDTEQRIEPITITTSLALLSSRGQF